MVPDLDPKWIVLVLRFLCHRLPRGGGRGYRRVCGGYKGGDSKVISPLKGGYKRALEG